MAADRPKSHPLRTSDGLCVKALMSGAIACIFTYRFTAGAGQPPSAMSDVFLSYKRDDLKKLQPLVKALRAHGLTVWWDQDIPPGARWKQTISREHGLAKAVVVAWSPAAVASEKVKAAAWQGLNEGKLLQVFVDACEPPMFFGERQGVNLVGWSGRADDHRFVALAAALDALIAGTRPPDG